MAPGPGPHPQSGLRAHVSRKNLVAVEKYRERSVFGNVKCVYPCNEIIPNAGGWIGWRAVG